MKRYLVSISLLLVMLMSAIGTSLAQTPTTNATGTVTAYWLNIRSAPSSNSTSLGVLQRGYSAGLVGKNADASWYQIILEGGTGWVSGAYLNVVNGHTVPVVTAPNLESEAFYGHVNTGALNIRPVASAVNNTPITTASRNERLGILGRTADNQWFKVRNSGNIIGWVRSSYLSLPAGDPVIPILSDGTTPSVQVTGYVNTGALNIRSVPSPTNNIPLRYILRNTSVSVVGRTGDSQWYQVTADGTTGWVRGKYITITNGNLSTTPITG